MSQFIDNMDWTSFGCGFCAFGALMLVAGAIATAFMPLYPSAPTPEPYEDWLRRQTLPKDIDFK